MFSVTRYWYTEEINMIWIIYILVDFMVYYYERYNDYRICFTYIRPLYSFKLLWKLIKFLVNLILKPLKAAGNKTIDIGKIIGRFIAKITISLIKTISEFIEKVGYLIYNLVKTILNTIWTGSKLTFELIMIPVKGVSSIYF